MGCVPAFEGGSLLLLTDLRLMCVREHGPRVLWSTSLRDVQVPDSCPWGSWGEVQLRHGRGLEWGEASHVPHHTTQTASLSPQGVQLVADTNSILLNLAAASDAQSGPADLDVRAVMCADAASAHTLHELLSEGLSMLSFSMIGGTPLKLGS